MQDETTPPSIDSAAAHRTKAGPAKGGRPPANRGVNLGSGARYARVELQPGQQYYWLRIRMPNGTRRNVTLVEPGTTLRAYELAHALRLAEPHVTDRNRRLQEIELGLAAPAAQDFSMAAIFEGWITGIRAERERRGRRESSLDYGARIFFLAVPEAMREPDLRHLTPSKVKVWLSKLQGATWLDRRVGPEDERGKREGVERPLTEMQILRATIALKSLLDFGAKETRVASPMPSDAVRIAKARWKDAKQGLEPEDKVWMPEDAGRIYRFALGARMTGGDAECVEMFLLCMVTGARFQEIARLRWSHIDFAMHALAVPGAKHQMGALRDVSELIPPAVWARLATYRNIARDTNPDALVFPRAWRQRVDRNTAATPHHFITSLCRAAGVPHRGWHAPRHSVISILPYMPRRVLAITADGREVEAWGKAYTDVEIQLLVGHTPGSATTRDVYSHQLKPGINLLPGVSRLDWAAIATLWSQAVARRQQQAAAELAAGSPAPLASSERMRQRLAR